MDEESKKERRVIVEISLLTLAYAHVSEILGINIRARTSQTAELFQYTDNI